MSVAPRRRGRGARPSTHPGAPPNIANGSPSEVGDGRNLSHLKFATAKSGITGSPASAEGKGGTSAMPKRLGKRRMTVLSPEPDIRKIALGVCL